jgi:hypothetical protein
MMDGYVDLLLIILLVNYFPAFMSKVSPSPLTLRPVLVSILSSFKPFCNSFTPYYSIYLSIYLSIYGFTAPCWALAAFSVSWFLHCR